MVKDRLEKGCRNETMRYCEEKLTRIWCLMWSWWLMFKDQRISIGRLGNSKEESVWVVEGKGRHAFVIQTHQASLGGREETGSFVPKPRKIRGQEYCSCGALLLSSGQQRSQINITKRGQFEFLKLWIVTLDYLSLFAKNSVILITYCGQAGD